jgi:beta-D-xylosidase 4
MLTMLSRAAAAAYNAGTDTVCEVAGYPPATDVVGAYNQSLLSEKTIDTALRRLYEGLTRAGYFDPAAQDPYRSISWSDVNTLQAQALALQSAADGIVLVKNNGALPMSLKGKSVAIIGHWSNATNQMLGGYSGIPPYYHNPVYAAQRLNLTYRVASGPVAQNSTSTDTWTTAAIDAASKSDVVLYFGGNDLSIESEDRDRTSIAWPQAQLTLITALAALGKPLVVSELGSPNDDSPLLANANVSAILWAGFPGQSGGTAVFDVLTGKTPPAGRLPVTQYPASYADAVPMTDMALRPSNATGNPGRTYMWYDSAVVPFGHGLHYTNFKASFGHLEALANGTEIAISDLIRPCGKIARQDLCPVGDGVPVEVSNAGNLTSDFVALAFLAGEYGPRPYPIKSLAAYGRVRGVKPGATAKVSLPPLTLGTLARVDLAGNTVLYPGRYRLLLDVPAQAEMGFTLTGEPVVLDMFPQPK